MRAAGEGSESSARPERPTGSAAGRLGTPDGRAHLLLRASFLDNRINSHRWDTWGFRLVPDVKNRLAIRVGSDKRSADNRRLAQGHYINAALMNLPDSVEEQLEMACDFLASRGGYTLPARQSTYRVSGKVWEKARDLDMEMTAVAKRGLVVFLFSAAVEKFIDGLDAEGPLRDAWKFI
jgi:hypothetical protein